MNQGASTLLSTPMYYAPQHIRVLRSPRTMSSHLTRVPRLRENSRQFHDLIIFKQCRSCTPKGRPLQLRYKQINSQHTMYKRNVQPEPRQLQHQHPTLHCKVPCVKVPITAKHRITQFQHRVQHHATHNHSTRTAVPIRWNVSTSLKTAQHHNRSSSCSGSSPSKTAMKFTNRKTQNASHTGRMHTNCPSIPQLTFETTSRQVPVRSPVKSSRFPTAIPLPFSTLTLLVSRRPR